MSSNLVSLTATQAVRMIHDGRACPKFCVRGITNAGEAYYAEPTQKMDRAVARLSPIPQELVAHFLTGPMTGEAINAAGLAFKQALIEASLNAELTVSAGRIIPTCAG